MGWDLVWSLNIFNTIPNFEDDSVLPDGLLGPWWEGPGFFLKGDKEYETLVQGPCKENGLNILFFWKKMWNRAHYILVRNLFLKDKWIKIKPIFSHKYSMKKIFTVSAPS